MSKKIQSLHNRLNRIKSYSLSVFRGDLESIKQLVAAEYGFTCADLEGKHRNPSKVEARMMFAYISRFKYAQQASLNDIGMAINRSHCAIIYYLNCLADLMVVDKKVKSRYETILTKAQCALN